MKHSIITKLKNRKVPQYLGSYLAIGFALLQFIYILVDRYSFSNKLVDLYLMVWILLIPTVVVLTYFGWEWNPILAKGNRKWPKILVATNFTTILVLGIFMLSRSASSANVPNIIEVTDEKGEVHKAMIPTLDKVKKVACFQFENIAENDEDDWWGVAFSQLLSLNLEQRPEYYANSAYGLNRFYEQLNTQAFTIPSVATQRTIALKNRNDYFTRISYNKMEDKYVFKGSLYEASNGKPIVSIDVTNESPFAAIDEIKQIIFDHIPNPLIGDQSIVELPCSTLLTENIEALKQYTKGSILFFKNPQTIEEVNNYFINSIQADQRCSYCYWALGDNLYGLGKREEAIQAFKKSIQYGETLPKRMQMNLKWTYYRITNNTQSYIQLLEMQRKMFPYNFNSYKHLSGIYHVNYGIDSAKVILQEAIKHGNKELGMLEMYDLQLGNKEYDAAENTLRQFLQAFPDREQDQIKFATLYEKQGKLTEARNILSKEASLHPFDVEIQHRIAFLEFRNHKPQQALQTINNALIESTNLTDSLYLYLAKGNLLALTGQIEKAMEVYSKYEHEALRKMPKSRILLNTITPKTECLMLTGRNQDIQTLIQEYLTYSPENTLSINCSFNITAITYNLFEIIDSDSFHECIDFYDTMGNGYREFMEIMYNYYNNNYQECITLLDRNQSVKDIMSDSYMLAKIYAKTGNKKEAFLHINSALSMKPYHPMSYFEYAKLLQEDKLKEAQVYLDIAMNYWEHADTDFIPKQKAIEFQNLLIANQ